MTKQTQERVKWIKENPQYTVRGVARKFSLGTRQATRLIALAKNSKVKPTTKFFPIPKQKATMTVNNIPDGLKLESILFIGNSLTITYA